VHCAVAARRCRRTGGPGRQGASLAARKALRGILVNPMPWSILLGVLLSAARWQLPGPLERTVAMLADAASPVALFTIGAVLARSALLAREHDASAAVAQAMGTGPPGGAKAPWSDVLPVVVVKLLVHPLLVWGLGLGAIALGLPLSRGAGGDRAGRGAAEREQRVDAGRALRGRQRAHRPHHPVDDGGGFLQLSAGGRLAALSG
jgi:malonate transporter